MDIKGITNFTPDTQQTLALARMEADRLNHNFVGTGHMWLGLIKLGQGVAVNVLVKLGLDLETVRQEVEKQAGMEPNQTMGGTTPRKPRVKRVIELAQKEAKQFHHTYVGTEHLLLGLLREDDDVAAKVLKNLNMDIAEIRTEILRELDPNFSPTGPSEQAKLKKDKTGPADAESGPPQDPGIRWPKPDPVDVSRHYDVYCVEHGQSVVYRNVRFKSVKGLFTNRQSDITSLYVELERADGKTIFLPKHTVFKFCDPGASADGEKVPPPNP